jgi:GNAT superfamily N-acetyltransferase
MSGLGDLPIRLRPGRAADAPRCSEIEALAARLFADSPHPELADLPAKPPGAYAAFAERGGLIAAEVEGGPVIGFAALTPEAETLHLAEIDVDPAFQRRGAARRMLEAAVERARALGLAGVTLTTWSDVIWNAPSYARMGFERLDAAAATPLCRAERERLEDLGLDVTSHVAMIRRLTDQPEASRR